MKFILALIFTSLVSGSPISDHEVDKRSISWLFGKEKPVEVLAPAPSAVATGTFPIWKAHKYNGVELRPIPAIQALPAVALEQAQLIGDQPLQEEQIRQINEFVALVPEEQLNTVDVRTLLPYTNLIPEPYVFQLQQALKAGVVKEKSKLKKILDLINYIKELKLKPFKFLKHKLFGKFDSPHPLSVVPNAPALPSYLNAHLIPEPPILPPFEIPGSYNYPTKFFGNSYVSVHTPRPEFVPAPVPVGVNYQTTYFQPNPEYVNVHYQTPSEAHFVDHSAQASATNEQIVPFNPQNSTTRFQNNFQQNPIDYNTPQNNNQIFNNPQIGSESQESEYQHNGPSFPSFPSSRLQNPFQGSSVGLFNQQQQHQVVNSSPTNLELLKTGSNFESSESGQFSSYMDAQKVTENNSPQKRTVLKSTGLKTPLFIPNLPGKTPEPIVSSTSEPEKSSV